VATTAGASGGNGQREDIEVFLLGFGLSGVVAQAAGERGAAHMIFFFFQNCRLLKILAATVASSYHGVEGTRVLVLRVCVTSRVEACNVFSILAQQLQDYYWYVLATNLTAMLEGLVFGSLFII
jgi:hypothetical protein